MRGGERKEHVMAENLVRENQWWAICDSDDGAVLIQEDRALVFDEEEDAVAFARKHATALLGYTVGLPQVEQVVIKSVGGE
jgi:hypothetical protein